MPSKTPKQEKFMAAAANDEKFAKSAGIPQSTAMEFHDADKAAGTYNGGGKKGHSDAKARAGQRKTWQGS